MQHDFILLDRSGSMISLWTEALSSINAYVDKLAEDNVDTGVTLATFDQNIGTLAFEVIRDRIIPRTWRKVSSEDAAPRGGTPLNDAVGKIVGLAKAGNYDKVAIIIMTDGQENASTELTVTQAKLLLDQCRARGWQVIFLGANFDNAQQATSYNTMAAQTVSAAQGNLRASTNMMAQKRYMYASGESATMDFSEDEKAELATPKSS